MADNNSHHETEPGKEYNEKPKPHAKVVDEGSLIFRDTDGSWQVDRFESTGDEEKDSLLQMPMSEFEDILDDENHPLYGKAHEVSVELAHRIALSVRPWGLVHPTVRKQFFGFLTDSNMASWFIRGSQDSRRGFTRNFELSLPDFLAQGFDFAGEPLDLDAGQFGLEDLKADFTSDEPEANGIKDPGLVERVESAPDSVAIPDRQASVIAHVVGWENALEVARKTLIIFERLSSTHDQWRAETKQATEDAGKQAERALEVAKDANRLAKDSNVLSSEANSHAARANETARDSHRLSICAFVISAIAALAAVGSWIWG